MRHSLFSRFQGGLLGSLLGEIAASPDSRRGRLALKRPLSPEMEVALSLLIPLREAGQLSEQDWQQIVRQQRGILAAAGSGQLAVMTLPLVIFFHDSPCRLREQVDVGCQVGQIPGEVREDALLWGQAIALALREKLQVPDFLTQLLAAHPTSQTPLRQQLQQIQSWLALGIPLSQAASQLGRQQQPSRDEVDQSLAAAIYCFSQTPEDFLLCVQRAGQGVWGGRLGGALAGALAGVYNSSSGIPNHWRLAIQQHPAAQKMAQGIPALFAAWSGHYEPQNFISLPNLALASPKVIQPRPSLKIISQQEGKKH